MASPQVCGSAPVLGKTSGLFGKRLLGKIMHAKGRWGLTSHNFLRICLVASLQAFGSTFAQGDLHLGNRAIGRNIDARVTFLDGSPVGAGYTAQMFGGPAGTPLSSMTPLLPTTIFRSSGPGMGYVLPTIVRVPGIDGGQEGTFVMRVFEGDSWESSLCRGESNPVTVRLTTQPTPPFDLVGLLAFQVNCIPEPSTAALGLLGAFAALLCRGKGRAAK